MNTSVMALTASSALLITSLIPGLDRTSGEMGTNFTSTENSVATEEKELPSPEKVTAPTAMDDPLVQQSFTDGERSASVGGAGGYTDEEVAEMQSWVQKTIDGPPPEDMNRPGEMWSDTVGLPPNVDKEEADQAEIQIAEETRADNADTGSLVTDFTSDEVRKKTQTTQFRAQSPTTNCQTFPFSSHQVCGAILERYLQLGGATSWLLWPTEPMTLNPDGVGYRQRFVNGFIYWHPSTGAHAVTTDTAKVWARHGWEAGWMGYPIGGEVPVTGTTPIDGETKGWVQLFQGGEVYRTPIVQGYQISVITGAILDRWKSLGGTESTLGFPIADEAIAADGVGRYSIFQQGVIYWHPQFGAWEITGTHLLEWVVTGKETGEYGYPAGPVVGGDMLSGTQNFEKKEMSQYVEPLPSVLDPGQAIEWVYELSPEPLEDMSN